MQAGKNKELKNRETRMERILITGAGGQLGMELTCELIARYGAESIVATDINPEMAKQMTACHFQTLDVMDTGALDRVLKTERITQIYHLAAILSATGEKKPVMAWQINMESLLNVLEGARKYKLNKLYWPSSIAVYGPNSPKKNTPQYAVKEPQTVYGISKLAGERWCEYYFNTYGIDVRSLRYPGLIGYKTLPGGGTTDYAVDIYRNAVANDAFSCFLEKDTYLPMMYMPDAIRATVELMEAPTERITVRSSYNIAGISFCPEDIYKSILHYLPDFKISYAPDFRQKIAEGWPQSINDEYAVKDWGWQPKYTLEKMTADMLTNLPQYMNRQQKSGS